ncbi:hypothetical protein FQZ97_408840 [compost metagenome]
MGRFEGGEEAVDVADGFGVGHHHVDLRRLHQPADGVAQGDVGFVAGGDADRRAQPALPRQAEQVRPVGAGLGGDADPPGQRNAAFQAGGEEGVVAQVGIEHAQRVRPQQAHVRRAGGFDDGVLHGHAFLADFAEAGGEHDGAARALAAQRLDGLQYLRRRHRDDRHVRRLGQRIDAGVGRQTLDFGAIGVHRQDAAGEAVAQHVGDGAAADAVRVAGGADHGDRARLHQGGKTGETGVLQVTH